MEDHQELQNQKVEDINHENATKKSGKRKIEIKPIKNKTSKQVTFSKRRNGLFKKASELCSLCGTELAVVAFSGAGKLFCFGHPSAEYVVLRYIHFSENHCLRIENFDDDNNNNNNNNHHHTNVCKIAEQYKEVLSNIDFEKKRINEVGSSSSNGSSPRGSTTTTTTNNNNNNNNSSSNGLKYGYWWDVPIDDSMGLNELEQLKVALDGLRVEVTSKIDEINRSSLMNVNPRSNSDDFGSSDGTNVVANHKYDESPWISNYHGEIIPPVSPMLMNSFFGHASKNMGN